MKSITIELSDGVIARLLTIYSLEEKLEPKAGGYRDCLLKNILNAIAQDKKVIALKLPEEPEE